MNKSPKDTRISLDSVVQLLDPVLVAVMIRQDDKIVFANKYMAQLTGFSTSELVGKSLKDILTPESLEAVSKIQKQREANHRDSIHTFVSLTHRNGNKADIEVMTMEVEIDGKISLISYIRDLTSLRHVQHLLKQSKKLLGTVLDDQKELIIRMNPALDIEFVNDAYCRFYGNKREDMVGTNLADWATPERVIKLRELLYSLTEARPISDLIALTTSASDGQAHWLEWSNRALFDKEGNVFAYQNVGRDVTRRILAEQAKEKSESLQNAFYKLFPDTFVLLDPVGNILEVVSSGNPPFHTGGGEMKFIGKNLAELDLTQTVRQQFLVAIDETWKTGAPSMFKFDRIEEEGQPSRTFEARLFASPEAQQLLLVVRDITSEEHPKRELRNLYASQAKLFSEIAHSLKTPFSITLTSLDALRDEARTEESIEVIDTIKHQISYANEQITNLLRISKLNLLPHSLEIVRYTELENLLRTSVDHARKLAKGYYPHQAIAAYTDVLELELDKADTPIFCDPRRLEEVLMMLLDNSLLHSTKKEHLPEVKVSTHLHKEHLEIRVCDKGLGIPQIIIDSLRLGESTDTGRYKGIGLLLCQKLIIAQGGKLEVENVGKGTCCKVFLRLA